jgi:hypothetical protein
MRKARFTEEQMVAIQRQPTQLVERPNRDSGGQSSASRAHELWAKVGDGMKG